MIRTSLVVAHPLSRVSALAGLWCHARYTLPECICKISGQDGIYIWHNTQYSGAYLLRSSTDCKNLLRAEDSTMESSLRVFHANRSNNLVIFGLNFHLSYGRFCFHLLPGCDELKVCV